jgi:hypothetical protein
MITKLVFLFYEKISNHTDTLGKVIDLMAAIGSILSAFFTLIGLVIAWKIGTKIAKNLSYHNKTVEYEYLELIKLINLTENLYFFISEGNGAHILERYYPFGLVDSELEKYLNYKLLFDIKDLKSKLSEIFTISNSVFLPNMIRNKLCKLHETLSNYKKLEWIAPQFPNPNDSIVLHGNSLTNKLGYTLFKDEVKFTLSDYIKLWDELIEEINNWFKKNEIDTRIEKTEKFVKPDDITITF